MAAAGMSNRDRFFSHNTLVCLIQGIQGRQTTVDLRNGASATGKIVQCDALMNIHLQHVLFRDGSGKPHIFDTFFVHSRNIRYVHIPPDVDMREAMESFLNEIAPVDQKKIPLRRVKPSLLRRQEETLAHISKMKEEKKASQD